MVHLFKSLNKGRRKDQASPDLDAGMSSDARVCAVCVILLLTLRQSLSHREYSVKLSLIVRVPSPVLNYICGSSH